MRTGIALTLAIAVDGCNLGFTAGAPETSLDPAEQASAALLGTGGDGDDWGAIGFSYDEARHSPLTDINASNVSFASHGRSICPTRAGRRRPRS